VVALVRQKYGLTRETPKDAEVVDFSADTRLSGINLAGRRYRKGASDSTIAFVKGLGATSIPTELADLVDRIARAGATPLVVSLDNEILGVINLKDIIKAGIQERFLQLRSMGIKTIMITGDNPLTAAAIAAEAQVDDFMAQPSPEDKLRLIKDHQRPVSWWP
jgi:ATPase, P-type (transporting), HAD superfamily, subfamily IC